MKVTVDSDLCQGHGQCNMACPEVFHFDDQGFIFVESEEVPAELRDAVTRAAVGCPERAIHTSGSASN